MLRPMLPALAVLAASLSPAIAQERGGVPLAPAMARGPSGLARPLPFAFPGVTAQSVQSSLKAPDFLSRHQAMVAGLRGDAGFLGGFSFGTPLSASVQPPVQVAPDPGFGFDPGFAGGDGGVVGVPVVVNNFNTIDVHKTVKVRNFEGPVAFTNGNGNVIQQQSAQGSGPIALQQVADAAGKPAKGAGHGADANAPAPHRASGAANRITTDGNIIQHVPGATNVSIGSRREWARPDFWRAQGRHHGRTR